MIVAIFIVAYLVAGWLVYIGFRAAGVAGKHSLLDLIAPMTAWPILLPFMLVMFAFDSILWATNAMLRKCGIDE